MARSHGSGHRCADERRVPRCDLCRAAHAKYAAKGNARYKATAKGMLAVTRSHANERGT